MKYAIVLILFDRYKIFLISSSGVYSMFATKVLITGGLGFIGLNLTAELITKNYSVVLYDNLSPQIHGNIPVIDWKIISLPLVSVVRGDIQIASI